MVDKIILRYNLGYNKSFSIPIKSLGLLSYLQRKDQFKILTFKKDFKTIFF